MEPDGTVPGGERGGVEERHGLGQRAPTAWFAEVGKGPLLAGQGQRLGYAGLTTGHAPWPAGRGRPGRRRSACECRSHTRLAHRWTSLVIHPSARTPRL